MRYPIVWVTIVLAMAVLSALAPMVSDHHELIGDLTQVRKPPSFLDGGSPEFLLGTDQVGRDVWTRMLYGGRISLLIAAFATVVGMLVGTTLGLLAGFFGGIADELIMRLVDAWIALPFIMLALVIAIVLGRSLTIMLFLLALIAWVGFVRPIRGEVLSLRERDYVSAARVAGASRFRLVFRHILPGVTSTIIVLASLQIGGIVLTESTLSFLGVGIREPTPTWGNMVSGGREKLSTEWWISTMPCVAISLLVLSFNFTGDWLRDRWDPQLRQL